MNRIELINLYETPCRFKLRGGKEVFGVIWENFYGEHLVHYFSSTAEYIRYKLAEQKNDCIACERLKTEVLLDDIIQAEPLHD